MNKTIEQIKFEIAIGTIRPRDPIVLKLTPGPGERRLLTGAKIHWLLSQFKDKDIIARADIAHALMNMSSFLKHSFLFGFVKRIKRPANWMSRRRVFYEITPLGRKAFKMLENVGKRGKYIKVPIDVNEKWWYKLCGVPLTKENK